MTITPHGAAELANEGVSCRRQTFHGTQRTAWLPVQLVRGALSDESGT